MSFFKKIIIGLNEKILLVSMLIILFLMLLTVGDVLGRFLFNKPIPGTFELTRIALVSMVFLSLGYGQIQKVYIEITLFVSRLPLLWQRIIAIFNYILSFILFSLVFWQMLKYAERLYNAGQYTTVLRLPMYPWILLAAAGVFILCLTFLWELIQTMVKLCKGDVTVE